MQFLSFKYLLISCKKAILLMSKNEEGALSLKEKFHLQFHTSMCTSCKNFKNQARIIEEESKKILADEKLPLNFKEKIGKMIKETTLL